MLESNYEKSLMNTIIDLDKDIREQEQHVKNDPSNAAQTGHFCNLVTKREETYLKLTYEQERLKDLEQAVRTLYRSVNSMGNRPEVIDALREHPTLMNSLMSDLIQALLKHCKRGNEWDGRIDKRLASFLDEIGEMGLAFI